MKRVMRAWIWSKSRQEEGYSVLSRSKIQVSISTKGRPRLEIIRAEIIQVRLAGPDQRSGAFGEQLEQNRVPHSAVDDDRRVDPAIDGVETGFDFGDHAAIDDAFGDQLPRLRRGELRDQLLVGIEHPGDVGQQQQARRLDRGGDGARYGVGVDVVGLARRTNAD